MKYAVVLCDGLADRPIEELSGKTIVEAADIPHIRKLSREGELGLVRTVPEGMAPGSDTANLSVMGYAPQTYYTGRSPLEAVSMGIELAPTDRTFRCNLVTLSGEGAYEDKIMADYSAGEITTEESTELIRSLGEALNDEELHLYPGISYRHCLVWKNAPAGFTLTPPHDISDRPVAGHLPAGEAAGRLLELMKRSVEILKDHPVNRARRARGLNTADSIWLWGDGTKPALTSFEKEHGLKASVISAVDLIKGIGLCAGMEILEVPGATGTVDSNFPGKAEAAIRSLKGGKDFVYIHMEAPDECGHHGDVAGKIRSIERIDSEVVAPLCEAFRGEELSILLLPDHPTPVSIKTHCSDPVPYLIWRSTGNTPSHLDYSEKNGAATGIFQPSGPALMRHFLGEE